MRRHLAAVAPLALVALALACRAPQTNRAIVASGHVEATDIHVSTKVAGRVALVARQEGAR